jgi:flavorubredoxin
MPTSVLFSAGSHRNLQFEDFTAADAVQANHHLIVHDGAAMILDPGGHKVYTRALGETMVQVGTGGKLTHIFLSHQDPDIVAALNGWLMTTDAVAYVSKLWLRFIPHFGLDRLVHDRLKGIPDEGQLLDLNGCPLVILPAHFLHSPGNFQVYDPVSKILYSGDLGASVGGTTAQVTDFAAHVKHLEGFHRRYMTSNKAMRAWVAAARTLDIETIAPQHGGLFKGRPMVKAFIDWCEALECGVDLMPATTLVPTK